MLSFLKRFLIRLLAYSVSCALVAFIGICIAAQEFPPKAVTFRKYVADLNNLKENYRQILNKSQQAVREQIDSSETARSVTNSNDAETLESLKIQMRELESRIQHLEEQNRKYSRFDK